MKKENLLGLFLMLLFITTIFSTGSCDNLINLESKETIQFASFESIPGGDGKADEVINWINIEDAIEEYYSYLKYNPTNERIAILDTGIDESVWTYYEDMIGESWLDIKLFDTNGQEILQEDATDDDYTISHGTTIFSLLVQILESYNRIKVGVSMYKVYSLGGALQSLVIAQLNRIYN